MYARVQGGATDHYHNNVQLSEWTLTRPGDERDTMENKGSTGAIRGGDKRVRADDRRAGVTQKQSSVFGANKPGSVYIRLHKATQQVNSTMT